MFGKGGLGNLMKHPADARKNAENAGRDAQLEVTGESGAGLVKVTINGAHNCRRVEIDRACWKTTKRCWKTWWLQHSTTQHVVLKKRRKKKWPLYPPECSCRLALRCRSDANQPAVNTAYGSTALSAGRWPKSAQRMAFTLLQRDCSGGMRLAQALTRAMSEIGHCADCRTFTEQEVCNIVRIRVVRKTVKSVWWRVRRTSTPLSRRGSFQVVILC